MYVEMLSLREIVPACTNLKMAVPVEGLVMDPQGYMSSGVLLGAFFWNEVVPSAADREMPRLLL